MAGILYKCVEVKITSSMKKSIHASCHFYEIWKVLYCWGTIYSYFLIDDGFQCWNKASNSATTCLFIISTSPIVFQINLQDHVSFSLADTAWSHLDSDRFLTFLLCDGPIATVYYGTGLITDRSRTSHSPTASGLQVFPVQYARLTRIWKSCQTKQLWSSMNQDSITVLPISHLKCLQKHILMNFYS